MNDYNNNNGEKITRKKRAKVTPKAVFGILCGTFFLFIISFLLSYMLVNHSLPSSGSLNLQKENEELKAEIERLEEKLKEYENDGDFAGSQVPDKYTGGKITAGGGEEPAKNSPSDSYNSSNHQGSSNKNNEKSNSPDEEESAFHGIITDEEIPAGTGISDAPVELN